MGSVTVPTITYTLSDGTASDTATLTLAVTTVNDAPVGNADEATGLEDGADVTGNVLANDTDIDTANGDFTVTGATVDANGDGFQQVLVIGTATTITDAASNTLGQLTLNSDGSFTFDPAADYNGTQGSALPVITYTLSDNDAVNPLTATSTLSITIGEVNDAPTLTGDTGTTAEDTAITVAAASGLLSNDGDLEGDTLAVTAITVGGTTLVVPAAGTTTTPVTSLGVSGGTALGTLSVSSDGAWSFTPALNYNTVDGPALPAISYTVTDDGVSDGTGTVLSDPRSSTAPLTITVTPANDAPTITTPPIQSVFEDTALVFSAANGNAVTVGDVDGDNLTTTLSLNHGTLTLAGFTQTVGQPAGTGTITSGPGTGAAVTGNATGGLTVSGTAAQINGALDGMSHQSVDDYYGPDPIAVTVSDGTAPVQSATVLINVDAVADIVDDTVTTAEDTTIAFNVLTGTNGAQADNFEAGAGATLTNVGVVTPPAHRVDYLPWGWYGDLYAGCQLCG